MDIYCKRINMPLPIPFYLRTNVSSALTHAEVDSNFTILSTKIDNTTCGNAGVGIGIFKGKDVNTNSGTMELYSLSGANGVSVTKSGDTIIIDGGGGIIDSDWITDGNNIYNGNSGSVSIGTTGVFNVGGGGNDTKLQTSAGVSGVPFTGLPISTTAVFESNTTNAVSLFSPDASISEIYFGTPSDVFGAFMRWDYTPKEFTLSTANPNGLMLFKVANGDEAMRIDSTGNVGIGTSDPSEKLTVLGDALIAGTVASPEAILTLSGNSFSDCQIKFENIGVSEPFAEIRGNTFGAGSSGNIEFFTYPSGGPLTKGMTISNTGKVGIGDISNNDITADLHVSGTTKMLDTLTLDKTPVNNESATEVLVRNSTSGDVEYRNGGTFNSGLFAQTGDSATVTNTTGETTIIGGGVGTLSVPANSFQIGNSYALNLSGKFRTDGGSQTITFRIDALSGSSRVQLATTGLIGLDNINSLRDFVMEMEFTVRNTGGPGTASLITSGYFDYVKNAGDLEGILFSSVESSNFDTTVTKTLDITAEWGAASTDNQVYTQLLVLRKIY